MSDTAPMNRPLPPSHISDAAPVGVPVAGVLRVAILGGGASGVVLALHLLAEAAPPEAPLPEVLLIEPGIPGQGVAYATTARSHLLNTRSATMSAYADRPDDFLHWLRMRDPAADAHDFAPRTDYGAYLADRLAEAGAATGRLRIIPARALRVDEAATGGVTISLEGGDSLAADLAVVATGHALPPPAPAGSAVVQPWPVTPVDDPAGAVLIVGSGLTMVDQVLSLLDAGHTGPIEVVSRRALLPRRHLPAPTVLPTTVGELPLGASAPATLRWLRARIRDARAAGQDWRAVVDGLRPHVARLWMAAPITARRAFLRHLASIWEVHRHRMPPASAARIEAAMASGQLTLTRAAYLGADEGAGQGPGRATARLRLSGGAGITRSVARIIDCRGIRRDPAEHAGPVIRDLLARGQARIDPLGIGIETDAEGRILNADGRPHPAILALGPPSRATFWEITAIPDIRERAARLAHLVTREAASWPSTSAD